MSKRQPSHLKMWLWETYGTACRRDVKDMRLKKSCRLYKETFEKVYMKNVALSKSRIFWTWLIKCLKTDIRFLNVCQKTLIP